MMKILGLLGLMTLFFFPSNSFAQFTITNPLKTNDDTGLKIGDNAYLTAAKGVDVNGDGWMRLTDAKASQKGYMYVQQSFPTSLGLIVDFEYTDWRDVLDANFGADGFSIFLFNGNITDAQFKLGGYGGSLGYATFSNPANTTGLSGGYLGVGFDSYGSYARAIENRNGGTNFYTPNSIVLRGPTTTTYNQSNYYLTRVDLGNRSGTLADIRQRNEIDYNTVSTKRPPLNVFYRRVQFSITKVGTNYEINIKWRKENETTFTDVITYLMNASTYPLPNFLKLGFAAATGQGFNYHEIRNILLTTPGNLRVDSRSDISFACNSKKTPITFKAEVTNDTATELSNINFNTKIKDANGNVLDISKFKITNISMTSNFTNTTLPTQNFSSNEINGTVGLPAESSGIVSITGEYIKGITTNSYLKAETSISSNVVTDNDLTNNIASTIINIRRCNVQSNPSLPTKSK